MTFLGIYRRSLNYPYRALLRIGHANARLRTLYRKSWNPPKATKWQQQPSRTDSPVHDRNVPLTDNFCPICNEVTNFDVISDQVLEFEKHVSRKVLYQCAKCQF